MSKSSRMKDRRNALRVDVPCMFACPAETNVPEYIAAVTRGDYDETHFLNHAKNLFPGSLGRVCTRPCEEACRHGYEGFGEAVSICRLKRVGSDFRSKSSSAFLVKKQTKTGRTVAVVGAGPAGLAAARDLLLSGHDVSIYEASDKLGGMLPLAIPEFRLPRGVIEEDVAPILALKPDLHLGMTLGEDIGLDDLLRRYDAVLLAVGCQRPYSLDVPGEEVEGVYHGLPFLLDVLGGKKRPVGRKALVVGGGYTAVDCARTLVRMGVDEVTMAYRRTEQEISIDREEMEHLEVEDVSIRYLTTATAFRAGEEGRLKEVDLVRTKLEGGRVVLLEDSKRAEAFDTAVICVGQGALGGAFIPDGLSSHFRKERLIVDENSFMSGRKGLFGAGDYVFGTRSIIDAVADGRRAAAGIHAFLTRKKVPEKEVRIHRSEHSGRERSDDFIPRVEERSGIGKRVPRMRTEVNFGYDEAEGHTESKRCYLCNLHYEIDPDNCIYCMRCIDEAPVDCIKMVKDLGDWGPRGRAYTETTVWDEIGVIYIDNDRCVRCGKCLDVCPTRCISATKHVMKDPIFGGRA